MAQDNVKNSMAKVPAQMSSAEFQRPIFEEDYTKKTGRKMRENPMVPIGMAGFFATVFYGIKHFKARPKNMSASMYVLQFRVFAQTVAVGCMGAGIAYTIIRDKFLNKPEESHSQSNGKKK